MNNSNNKDKINVILADDHPVVRKALKNELAQSTEFKMVAEASDGFEAVKLAIELKPHIIIMDIGLPGLNGIEATRQIKKTAPEIIVLVLTVYDDIEHVLGILESGADGYLTKTILVEEIITAIRAAVSGEIVLSPQIFKKVLKYALRHNFKPVLIDSRTKLTLRELEILKFLLQGIDNKKIANELDIQTRTVKSHLTDIYTKLNVSTRTEAVITALRAGFLNIDDIDNIG